MLLATLVVAVAGSIAVLISRPKPYPDEIADIFD